MTCTSAKLISYTQPAIGFKAAGPEGIIAHCARVSSDRDYDTWGENAEGLLKYCMRNKHWSVFEMADATVEIEAPRDISRQLLRHRSFCFQEFSQRYSDNIKFCEREWREQDNKNRQNSLESFDDLDKEYFEGHAQLVLSSAQSAYNFLRNEDVAKECARVVLPEGLTMSMLYMKGSLRSWLHYLEVRDDEGVTQAEHVQLARQIREAIKPVFPTVFGMMEDVESE